MGDAADDAQDREEALAAMFEFQYLSLSNEELFKYTSRARNPKIVSIRKWWKEHQKLSDKQRYCLAMWLWENDEGGNE